VDKRALDKKDELFAECMNHLREYSEQLPKSRDLRIRYLDSFYHDRLKRWGLTAEEVVKSLDNTPPKPIKG
jgi:hypothetical protein